MLAAKTHKPKAAPAAENPKTSARAPQAPAFNPVWAQLALSIQPKLAISAPDDPFEREADRVADQVMRMPDRPPAAERPVVSSAPEGKAKRKCAACDEEDEKLQRKESGNAVNAPATAPPIVHEALSAPGQPLDSATRGFFEPRFGRDFRSVRVHADEQADTSACSIDALAFTLGRDVVFRSGQYAPDSNTGRRLI